MKVIKSYMGISLLTVLLLFSGCGKEMEDITIPETGSGVESSDDPEQTEGEIFRLQVSDAGFCDANTGSRATDSGLTTIFENGDTIGLFVVNNENKVLHANVPFTYNGKTWTAEQTVRIKGYPARVFAYYPYVKDTEIIEKVNSTAEDASVFFSQYISELEIEDQSTPELYRKADVMTCMVSVANMKEAREPLKLTMNHMMGLVIVNLPGKSVTQTINYKIDGKSDYVWSGSFLTNISREKISVPAWHENNSFRYLYKPGKVSFSCEFYTNNVKKSYEESIEALGSGNCKTYNIIFPKTLEQKIEIGDFYLNDGSLRSKDASLTDEEKQKCIGIVCYTGNFSNSVNGKNRALVIGLKEQVAAWCTKSDPPYLGLKGGSTSDGFVGYEETQKLLKYKNDPDYPIVNQAYQTLSRVALPYGRTSNWYIPSILELSGMSNNRSSFKPSLTALGTSLADNLSYYIWSIGEAGSDYATVAWTGAETYSNKSKSNVCSVRLFFAF